MHQLIAILEAPLAGDHNVLGSIGLQELNNSKPKASQATSHNVRLARAASDSQVNHLFLESKKVQPFRIDRQELNKAAFLSRYPTHRRRIRVGSTSQSKEIFKATPLYVSSKQEDVLPG